MSKDSSKRRAFKIKVGQKRKKKLAKLRQKFLEAKTEEAKQKVLEKVFRIAPFLSKEEFLASTKK